MGWASRASNPLYAEKNGETGGWRGASYSDHQIDKKMGNNLFILLL